MKEQVLNGNAKINPHLMTIATLTGHACLAVGVGYSVSVELPLCRLQNFTIFLIKNLLEKLVQSLSLLFLMGLCYYHKMIGHCSSVQCY